MRCADYSTFTLRGSTISKPVLNSSNRPRALAGKRVARKASFHRVISAR